MIGVMLAYVCRKAAVVNPAFGMVDVSDRLAEACARTRQMPETAGCRVHGLTSYRLWTEPSLVNPPSYPA
jgi:hypothetical protein